MDEFVAFKRSHHEIYVAKFTNTNG